jgi:cellulose synthase/poly-beta-1,6-N-acetylglucosamine synthase-like glycosyltransferase
MVSPAPSLHASVIVPAYNAAATLQACLDALESQTIPRHAYEVIVVDDGSTDATPDLLQKAEVTALHQPHASQAAARNRGAEAARGEILLFTDADCEPEADWIERMLAPFQEPGVAGVKGRYRTRQRSLVARFVQAEFEEKYARLARQDRIDFVDTHAAGYRRDLFLESGGFDVRFPVDEDQELSFRLARAGHRLVFEPDAVVFHQHPERLWTYLWRKVHFARWKVLVVLLHPARAWRDSYTPLSQKLQMGLWALWLAASGVALAGGTGWGWAGGLAGLGLASSLPFVARTARTDPGVAAAAPLLLWGRAAVLSLGVSWGLLGGTWLRSRQPTPGPLPAGAPPAPPAGTGAPEAPERD